MPVTGEEIRESIGNPVVEALDAEGVSLKYLVQKLKRELNAKETKFFQKDGIVIQKHDVVDWGTRQRARMDAHKLRGDYAPDKVEHGGAIAVNHHVTPEIEERLNDFLGTHGDG